MYSHPNPAPTSMHSTHLLMTKQRSASSSAGGEGIRYLHRPPSLNRLSINVAPDLPGCALVLLQPSASWCTGRSTSASAHPAGGACGPRHRLCSQATPMRLTQMRQYRTSHTASSARAAPPPLRPSIPGASCSCIALHPHDFNHSSASAVQCSLRRLLPEELPPRLVVDAGVGAVHPHALDGRQVLLRWVGGRGRGHG